MTAGNVSPTVTPLRAREPRVDEHVVGVTRIRCVAVQDVQSRDGAACAPDLRQTQRAGQVTRSVNRERHHDDAVLAAAWITIGSFATAFQSRPLSLP